MCLRAPSTYAAGTVIPKRCSKSKSGLRTSEEPGSVPPVLGLPASMMGHVDLARRNRSGGMTDVREVDRAAVLGRVAVLRVEAEVIHHRQRADAGRVGGGEVRVNVRERQPRVGERAESDVGVDLRERPVGQMPARMLVRTDDERRALERARPVPVAYEDRPRAQRQHPTGSSLVC